MGAWSLFGYEDRETESDPWTPTFGKSPSGIVVYGPAGLLSVQVAAAADDPSGLSATSGTSAPTSSGRLGEMAMGSSASWSTTWSPHIHPELLDEGPDRPFRIVGDELTLGDGRTWRRLLKRVSS